MDTPGYDPVSATGQVAGGANLICFTTGRGSAYGCAPSPSLKLIDQHRAVAASRKTTSTSTAATSIDGTAAIDEMGERIFRLMLDTASGRKTKSEVARLRPERVRALVARRGDVRTAAPARRRFPCRLTG